jgi:hypothetical protein
MLGNQTTYLKGEHDDGRMGAHRRVAQAKVAALQPEDSGGFQACAARTRVCGVEGQDLERRAEVGGRERY